MGSKTKNLSAKPGERDPQRRCRCHGPLTRAYRGQCLPSFMIIGSQKAATSKLRWYVSRHPEIRIPKEENFHKGPPPVAAWDTESDPTLLTRFLDNLDDVCDIRAISGLRSTALHARSSAPQHVSCAAVAQASRCQTTSSCRI